METKDIEKVIMQQAAAAFVTGMPEETRVTLMNQAMATVLAKTVSSYSVEQAIGEHMKADMFKYVDEYLLDPEVQERLKKSAHEAVERLFDNVITSMGVELRNNMKSQYCKFEPK